MKGRPAIVRFVQLRALHVELAPTDTVTEPLPAPFVGVTVTQLLHGFVVVQGQPLLLADTATVKIPAPDEGLQLGGLLVKLHTGGALPDCVIRKLRVALAPLTVIVFVRELTLGLAVMA